MNDIQHTQDYWQSLGDDWREQPASRVDVEALLHGIRQRGRRLRWAVGSELAGTGAMLGVAAWATRSPEWAGNFPLVAGALIAAALVFQLWSLWARRGQVRDLALDLVAMINLDIARAQTTLRYWRVSVWLSVAMLVAMLAAAVTGAVHERIWFGLLASAVPGLGFAAWAWWRCRRIRELLTGMQQIRDELQQE